MRTLEATGKSIDEAIFNGLRELQISIDEVEIDIIQQETKGVFGIGAKPAIVRLIEREPEEVVIPDYIANKDKPRERRPRREARGPREERRERRAPEPREMQLREDAQALQEEAGSPEDNASLRSRRARRNKNRRRSARRARAGSAGITGTAEAAQSGKSSMERPCCRMKQSITPRKRRKATPQPIS